jgi:hypothetical protein
MHMKESQIKEIKVNHQKISKSIVSYAIENFKITDRWEVIVRNLIQA